MFLPFPPVSESLGYQLYTVVVGIWISPLVVAFQLNRSLSRHWRRSQVQQATSCLTWWRRLQTKKLAGKQKIRAREATRTRTKCQFHIASQNQILPLMRLNRRRLRPCLRTAPAGFQEIRDHYRTHAQTRHFVCAPRTASRLLRLNDSLSRGAEKRQRQQMSWWGVWQKKKKEKTTKF